jgi:mono/diheme cytochrome c family protein
MDRAGAWVVGLGLALGIAGCNGSKDGDTAADTSTEETGTTPDTQTGTTSTGDARVATILAITADAALGADVYARNCQACHGPDGTGTLSGADLTDRLTALTDEQVVRTVLDGKGNMDSYASLPNQDIADVVAHVSGSFRVGTMR